MIRERLFALQDMKYRDFQANLTPTMQKDDIIGVRVPELRKLAKEIAGTPEADVFLKTLPHRYYDENMLHSILLGKMKDFDDCMDAVNAFLPYVDNWAVCDTLSPKIFGKNLPRLLEQVKIWIASEHSYTVRFAINMLMTFWLDDAFAPEYPEMVAAVRSEEYYVNMMIAWYFATALAKQYDAVLLYLQERRLAPWTHGKTIQKAVESYRISDERKNYLRTLRISDRKMS